MTSDDQVLLKQYLTHRHVIGYEGDYPDFESWYRAVRYAQGAGVPATLRKACELRYKDALEAARVFNGLQAL